MGPFVPSYIIYTLLDWNSQFFMLLFLSYLMITHVSSGQKLQFSLLLQPPTICSGRLLFLLLCNPTFDSIQRDQSREKPPCSCMFWDNCLLSFLPKLHVSNITGYNYEVRLQKITCQDLKAKFYCSSRTSTQPPSTTWKCSLFIISSWMWKRCE